MRKFPKEFANILNINYLVDNIDTNKLKVELKYDKLKGICLYCKKPIKKGEIIAFYKIKVFPYKSYKSPTNNVYAFDVYSSKEKLIKTLIGDIDLNSFPDPINNITFWAPFANESIQEKSNSEIDINTCINYSNKNKIKKDDIVIYNLIAKKNIKKGEEITWYYGENYKRDYDLI